MSVSQTSTIARLSGDGSSLSFPFSFNVFADSDVKVFVYDSVGETLTEQVLGSDYSVNISSPPTEGGTVDFVSAPALTATVILYREQTLSQPTELEETDEFTLNQLENQLDKLVMITQEISREAGRGAKFPLNIDLNIEFPQPADGQFLVWDGVAGKIINSSSTVDLTPLQTQITTNAGDIADNVTDIATNAGDITTNAGNITTNAGNISTNSTDISTNTGNIATNVTNISTNAGDIVVNAAAAAANLASLAGKADTVHTHVLADITDFEDAGDLPSTAAGNLGSTNVQDALEELQSDIDGLSVAAGSFGNPVLSWNMILNSDSYALPIFDVDGTRETFQFDSNDKVEQICVGLFIVPENFVSGDLKMLIKYYAKFAGGDAQWTVYVNLYRDSITPTDNYASFVDGSSQTIVANTIYSEEYDLTTSGQIGSTTVLAGDMLEIFLQNNGASNTSTTTIYLLNNTAEVFI